MFLYERQNNPMSNNSASKSHQQHHQPQQQHSSPTAEIHDGKNAESQLYSKYDICEVLGVGMEELIRGDGQGPVLLTELSDVQEQELIADARLLLITYLVLNDWKFAEILAAFRLDENELLSLLLRLDAMKIIDYRPPTRIRKLTARNFSWRTDGPAHAFFVERILPDAEAHRTKMKTGADVLMAMPAEAF